MFSILISLVTCCRLIHLGMENFKQLSSISCTSWNMPVLVILTPCQYFFSLLIVLHWLHYSSNLSLHAKQAKIISTVQKNYHPEFSDRGTFLIVLLQEPKQINNCSSAHPWGIMLGVIASWTLHHWWQLHHLPRDWGEAGQPLFSYLDPPACPSWREMKSCNKDCCSCHVPTMF